MKTKYIVLEVEGDFSAGDCEYCSRSLACHKCHNIDAECPLANCEPAVKVDNSLSRAIGEEVFVVKKEDYEKV